MFFLLKYMFCVPQYFIISICFDTVEETRFENGSKLVSVMRCDDEWVPEVEAVTPACQRMDASNTKGGNKK